MIDIRQIAQKLLDDLEGAKVLMDSRKEGVVLLYEAIAKALQGAADGQGQQGQQQGGGETPSDLPIREEKAEAGEGLPQA